MAVESKHCLIIRKLVRLVKIDLSESYTMFGLGKHLSDALLINNGLKQSEVVTSVFGRY
jgi:hypothetical protein